MKPWRQTFSSGWLELALAGQNSGVFQVDFFPKLKNCSWILRGEA
jgi:hypothetical protein